MVAYTFKRRFIAPILDGTKIHTLRNVGRRRHAKPGSKLQLYYGLRSPGAFIIAERTCIRVPSITIRFGKHPTVEVSDLPHFLQGPKELDGFARYDGFENWPDLEDFWAHEHKEIYREAKVWSGYLIGWEPVKP